MKQRITPEQLQELSPKQQEKLRAWWNDHRQEGDWYAYSKNEEMIVCDECRLEHGYSNNCYNKYLPLLSIGQMLQLIDEHGYINYQFIVGRSRNSRPTGEFCDMLWGDIKVIL